MISELLQQVTDEYLPTLAKAGIILRLPLCALKIGDDGSSSLKANWLVFNQDGSQPVFVIRTACSMAHQARLKHEFAILGHLSTLKKMEVTTPTGLALLECSSCLAMMQNYLPGISLYHSLLSRQRTQPALVKSDLENALATLWKIQQATLDGVKPFDAAGYLQQRLALIISSTGQDGFLAEQAKKLSTLQNIGLLSLPTCGRHNDYWPGNLLFQGNSCAVIDWEGYIEADWPFYDILFFCITYILCFPWKGGHELPPVDAFRYGFLEDNWLSNEISQLLAQALTQVGISRQWIGVIFNLFFLEMLLPARGYSRQYPDHQHTWLALYQAFVQNQKAFQIRYE